MATTGILTALVTLLTCSNAVTIFTTVLFYRQMKRQKAAESSKTEAEASRIEVDIDGISIENFKKIILLNQSEIKRLNEQIASLQKALYDERENSRLRYEALEKQYYELKKQLNN